MAVERCRQCGQYYELTTEWDNHIVCSDECCKLYIDYLNKPVPEFGE